MIQAEKKGIPMMTMRMMMKTKKMELKEVCCTGGNLFF